MPDEKGNWYIAKCPTFEEGQKCSVGIGGTGTVVTQQSKAKELAAEFLCWAKMSEVGEQNIWDTLGFDVCNTACWTNDTFAHNDENQYNQFFINYPYDVLNSIGMDNIGKISVVKISLQLMRMYVIQLSMRYLRILITAWMTHYRSCRMQ